MVLKTSVRDKCYFNILTWSQARIGCYLIAPPLLVAIQDVAAKIMADNQESLTALAAHDSPDLTAVDSINQAYAHAPLKPLAPALLLGKKRPNCFAP
jgi:hypothetical protein